MIGTADRLIFKCEEFIAQGNKEEARKCAKGISILTGQDEWERAYQLILDDENPFDHVTQKDTSIPDWMRSLLNDLHDKDGVEFPHQSVKKGTQVSLTNNQKIMDWIKTLTDLPIVGAWTVRLPVGGFHIPHIHPRGGKSTVIYIDTDCKRTGYLYFGIPRYLKTPIKHKINPHRGLMVSFPNWLWHGVSIYMGERPRLTVVFDADG